MRAVWWGAAIALSACGTDEVTPIDARELDAATVDARPADAAVDAPPCAPTMIFTAGADPAAQGWMVNAVGPAMLTTFGDHLRMETSTGPGAPVSAFQLLYKPQVVTAGQPFALQVVMEVVAVDVHNQFDAGAAIMGSYSPPVGAVNDRSEMIYLDPDRIGWADDTESHAVAVTNGTFHTYVLAVDGGGTARVTIDGAPALVRKGFTTNGAIAIGDQTNDHNIDSMLRLRSVALLCP